MALARFYRNSPFSESVRDKFDVVMTRLFSRCFDDEKRQLIFTREIMAGHIQTLYSNWSSILLYSAEENSDEIKLAISNFEALITEAERAETFDELLEVDFFELPVLSYQELTPDVRLQPVGRVRVSAAAAR